VQGLNYRRESIKFVRIVEIGKGIPVDWYGANLALGFEAMRFAPARLRLARACVGVHF
jgi:hypothetical protein